ncbi:hypothetical protein GLIP_3677 [Aliiglaciecola lipolytica E3]|uniref:Uncharacterized protein n=1 Tax=Aliiglaciecola lipolytica E3 TaxID=1127673 RepID=K6YI81_9ALTE|nr:hypothetical protein GLIP_3677 [Aliiglaciecola lipolytica E3]
MLSLYTSDDLNKMNTMYFTSIEQVLIVIIDAWGLAQRG